MVTAVIINLDFIPLAFFFFLYSALEILIARTMEDHHRFRLIHTDQEDEEFESEEEFEGEDEEDDEFEEDGADPFRQRIILPVEFEEDGFDDDGEEIGGVFEDDDEFEDDGFDEDEEDDGFEEEDEELVSLERMLNRVPIEYEEDEDDDEEDEDYEDEDEDVDGDVDGEDYDDDEEDDEVVDRVSSSGFNGRRLQVDDEAEMESHRFLSSGFGGRSLQVDDEAEMESRRVSSLGFGGRSLQFDTQAVIGSRRVSRSVFYEREGVEIDSGVVESTENMNDLESCEGKNEEQAGSSGSSGEVHGLFCSICFEAWTSGGEHQICCLPCGHIYGLSCIKKWLQQSRPFGKCPQCNNLCTFKDVRVLYASRLCVADEELHKRVRSLEAKCAYLEQKAGRLTPAEMVDQICSNPAALQQLATAIAGLYHQPVSP